MYNVSSCGVVLTCIVVVSAGPCSVLYNEMFAAQLIVQTIANIFKCRWDKFNIQPYYGLRRFL